MPCRIGLISPCGYGNLGDAAIQESMIQAIRKRISNAEITMFTLNPYDTTARHGIQALPLTLKPLLRAKSGKQKLPVNYVNRQKNPRLIQAITSKLKKIIREGFDLIRIVNILERVDRLYISGGGQIDDYWGGAWGHPFTLFKWISMARILKVPVAFLSVGAGPLDSPLSKVFTRFSLRFSKYNSFRDSESLQLVQKIGFRGKTVFSPDLAFSMFRPVSSSQVSTTDNQRLKIGISPFAYFDPRVWPEKDSDRYNIYLNKLAGIIEWINNKGNSVLLFPTQFRHDIPAIEDLIEILNKRDIDHQIEHKDYEISELSQLFDRIENTDIVISSRLHGIILSLCRLKPVIAISYHPKVSALMHELGYQNYCIDIEKFKLNSIQSLFASMEKDLFSLSKDIEIKLSNYYDKLVLQYDMTI